MPEHHENCLICGAELVYFEKAREMECVRCHRRFMSNAQCANGHYICDACHEEEAVAHIRATCLAERDAVDPIAIADAMMRAPFVHMHGPEHHVLFAAALLAAYDNAGGRLPDRAGAFDELKNRATQVPGGVCGFWGACGAGIATGIFISLVSGATPLSQGAWGMANRMTSQALAAIGAVDGPRCCKRDGYLAMTEAVRFVRENLGVQMAASAPIRCTFLSHNPQCIGRRCPFAPVNAAARA